MKRRKSIVTVEGFEQSYVDINAVLKKKGIVHGGGSSEETTPTPESTKSSLDTPVGVYGFSEPLTEGQSLNDSLLRNKSFRTAFNAGFDSSTNDGIMIDSANGKIYSLHSEGATITVTDVEDLKEGTIYYDGLIESYVTFKVVPAFGQFPMSVTEQLVSTPAYVRNATIHHDGDAYTVGIGTYDAETAVADLTPGAYYKAMNADAEGVEVFQITADDSVVNHPLYPVINFTGRFLAKIDKVRINLPKSISGTVTNPDIEAGHVYEYSILDGVFSIIDVTSTSNR